MSLNPKYNSLGATFVVDGYAAPVVASWTSATTVNTALTVNCNGMDTVVLTYIPSGTVTGGVLTFEVYDGANWVPMRVGRSAAYATEITYALAGGAMNWQIGVAGYQQFRAKLSTVVAGSGTALITAIVSSTPDVSNVIVGVDTTTLPIPVSQATGYTAVATGVGNTVIKNSPGGLVKLVVTVAGSAASSIYDNASTNSGTVLFTFPTTTTAGQVFDVQIPLTNGATAAGASGSAGFIATYS